VDCCSWALCEALLLIDHVWSQERSKETRGRWRPGTAWVKSLGFSFDGFWVPDPEMAHHSWSFRHTYYFIYFTICSYHFHHWNILKLHPFRVRNFIHYPKPGGSKCHTISQPKQRMLILSTWLRNAEIHWDCLKVIQKGLMVMAIWQRMALLCDGVEPGENGDWLIDNENKGHAFQSPENRMKLMSGFRGTHFFQEGSQLHEFASSSLHTIRIIRASCEKDCCYQKSCVAGHVQGVDGRPLWVPLKASVRVGAEWKFRNCWFHSTATPRN
jgi:hypothetical protein